MSTVRWFSADARRRSSASRPSCRSDPHLRRRCSTQSRDTCRSECPAGPIKHVPLHARTCALADSGGAGRSKFPPSRLPLGPAHRHPPPAQGDRPDRAAAGWPSGPGRGGPSVRTARRRRRPSSRPFAYRPASTAMTSRPSWASAAISPITIPTRSGTSGAGDSVVVLVRASSSRRPAGLPGLADKARRGDPSGCWDLLTLRQAALLVRATGPVRKSGPQTINLRSSSGSQIARRRSLARPIVAARAVSGRARHRPRSPRRDDRI